MPKLHLLPTPDCQMLGFPVTARNTPESLIGQLANIQSLLSEKHGAYLGRLMFAEAAVITAARAAFQTGSVPQARRNLMEDFDDAIDQIGNTPQKPGAA